jgi:hypothetical protein
MSTAAVSFFLIFAPKSHNNQSLNNMSAQQTFTLGILGFELKPDHYGEALI